MSANVSVVVTAWNNWPHLHMAVASALHQSVAPLEVIVVDNSSTDATPDQVRNAFGQSVRYLRQPNRGCAGAHNTGLALAKGELVQFLAGDDVLAPDKLERQLAVFASNEALDIVYGDIRMFGDPGGGAAWEDIPTRAETDMLHALIAPRAKGGGINVLGALFRRSALDRIGPWDESLYCEDTEYWLRAAAAGCRFGHCPGGPMGFKRMWAGQKIADATAASRGLEAAWNKALDYVRDEPYRSMLEERLARYRIQMAVSGNRFDRSERYVQLQLARAASGAAIGRGEFAVARVAATSPAARAVWRSRPVRGLRRAFAAFGAARGRHGQPAP